ncbi:MAG: hypothetical protein ABI665_28155, partial [Vicinamibacterales bacterium]
EPSSTSGALGVHLMLVAFGIENLLKAALVRARSSDLANQLEPSSGLPRELKTHDLTKLARLLSFDLDLDEEGLLRRLARAATWGGRYPIPVGVEARSTTEVFSDGSRWAVAYNWPGDIDRFKALVSRVRSQLQV